MTKKSEPQRPRREYLDHDCLSATELCIVLGHKSDGEKLSEEGLQSLMDLEVIPRPFMLGKFRRWRWGAIRRALEKLEKQAQLLLLIMLPLIALLLL